MSVLSEFVVPADEFVLADTLTTATGMHIEIKRVVAGQGQVTPYFWASGGDFDAFEQALRDDDMVREMLTLEEQEEDQEGETLEDRFYRVSWENETPNLIVAISEAKATVLEAVSADGTRWELKVLFPDDDALSAFDEYCTEHDLSYEPQRIYRSENPEARGEYGVTEPQEEGLVAAYHAGYFAVPRDTSLSDLADELDISRNALSARLRRGHRNLLANTLVHEE